MESMITSYASIVTSQHREGLEMKEEEEKEGRGGQGEQEEASCFFASPV